MDRRTRLRELATDLTDRPVVENAWTAKSFTDRLFVVDVTEGADLPEDLIDRLHDHGLVGYNEVHDVHVEDDAFAGDIEGRDRYKFVDTEARGDLQSYVVE